MFESSVIDWLLEEDNPSIRYRTFTELLEEDEDDSRVKETKERIKNSEAVKKLFDKMNDEGYWYFYNRRTGSGYGDGVEYTGYVTTHFNLNFLSELGMTREDERIEKAVNRYLNLQKPDGDFMNHFSCLYAYNLRAFIRMGFREDERVKKTIQLLLNSGKTDGGYLCDNHEGKHKTRETKSCIRGSLKALLAFTELPEYQESDVCRHLVSYFLKRQAIFKNRDLKTPAVKEITLTSFPFLWRTSLIEVVYGLSSLGYGNTEEMKTVWEILESKRDREGKYILDWTPGQVYFKPDKKGEASKWTTFYALLSIKKKERIK